MNLELAQKVVVITGGTGGIGQQIVADFLEEKCSVVCLIRSETKMDELKKELQNQNIDISLLYHISCNLLDYESMKKASANCVEKHGRIDVLVNCAGFADEYPFAMLDPEKIDQMLDLNLKSPMLLTHVVLRSMFKQKSGSIINISSASTVKKGRGIVAYASAKSGLETFTRSLAIEVGRKNIRVNCIRPGVIKTSMSEAVIFRLEETINKSTALERVGTAKEISKAVLFVASDAASYMTGECITIDGGMY